ncbi:MAG: hypothetical protein MUO27_00775 [Sedimentisphaerales bacterium]|nr:hypothetical protein [Sedimentisphaerales bacterium]
MKAIMKRRSFLSSVLFFVVLGVGTQHVMAGQEVEYYKAGDVGAFSVDVVIPPNINIDATVFTAQASDKKAYLLYVRSSGSIAQRVTNAMESEYHLSAEQEEFQKQVTELYQKRGKVLEKLSKAKNELDALKGIKQKAEKDQDNAFVEKTQLIINQLETTVTELEGENKKLDEQFRAFHEKQRTFWSRPSVKTIPEQVSPSLKIFGRFQGSGKVKLSVYAMEAAKLLAEPNLIASIDLELPSVDTGNPELLKQWATAQAQKFMVRVLDSPYTSYYQYCLLQSKAKYGLPTDLFYGVFPEERRSRRPDIYSMTTGALAIQESLQLEEMTGAEYVPSQSDVPLNTLAGPGVKSHPFDEMLKGRASKMFPVAALVPYDNYYCHFTSISKEVAASDLIKQWGTSLLRMMTVTARDADLPSRYTDQLCIDVSVLTRLFGDLVIGEIAITGGDPFLREGSDVAIIIQVKNNMIFDKMMKSYADKAIKSNKDAQVSDSEYNGVAIRSIVTADHRISSHSAYLGSYKVYSNSIDTLKLIMDTNAKKRKSMADNLDFQYMRTIFPGTVES